MTYENVHQNMNVATNLGSKKFGMLCTILGRFTALVLFGPKFGPAKIPDLD